MAKIRKRKRRSRIYENRKDTGWIALYRGWQDHPFFKEESFSLRDAWAWMIEEAVYLDDGSFRVINGHKILLMRGQFSHSLRFMAEAWGWDDSKVDRYLKSCQREEMIKIETETGQNIITICNYERYQLNGEKNKRPRKTLKEKVARQEQDSDETKIEEGEEGEY